MNGQNDPIRTEFVIQVEKPTVKGVWITARPDFDRAYRYGEDPGPPRRRIFPSHDHEGRAREYLALYRARFPRWRFRLVRVESFRRIEVLEGVPA